MPRTPRVDAPGAIHHVIAKGSGGEPIVCDGLDCQLLLRHLAGTSQKHHWTCLAYCLLDTHFHVVVATAEANLGVGMQRLLAPYARKFNKRHERAGNLFHTRFYSTHIESDEHLRASIVYVLLNPVRAGVAKSPELWPWSSYGATIGTAEPEAFLATEAVLELFDADRRTARSRLKLAVSETRQRDFERMGVRHGVGHGV